MGQPHHQHQERALPHLLHIPPPHVCLFPGDSNISPISSIHRPWSSPTKPTMAKRPKLGPIPHLCSKALTFSTPPRSLPGLSVSPHPSSWPHSKREHRGVRVTEQHQAVLCLGLPWENSTLLLHLPLIQQKHIKSKSDFHICDLYT